MKNAAQESWKMHSLDCATPTTLGGLIVPAVTGEERANDPTLVKALHVINGEHFAGAERVQQILGKRLGAFGYDPLFAMVKPGEFRNQCRLRRYQLFDVEMKGRFDLSVSKRIADIATEQNAAILHAHTPRTAMIASQAAKILGLPWVYHVHSPTVRDSTRGVLNRINAFIESRSLKTCDLAVTVSKSLRREMLRRGVARERLAVVPNGVYASDPIPTAKRMSQTHWRMGLVALMRPRKGVDVAIQALRRLADQGASVELELIGSFETAEYEQQIRSLIESCFLQDRVRLTGFTNDIPGAISRLDCLLLPSLFGEGMPMVVLEAISAGVPVIATDVEGTPEVIRDGVEGYLVPPGCPDSLAQSMQKMIGDRQQWSVFSKNALARHGEKFSDNAMAAGIAKAYDRVLSKSQQG